MAGRGKTGHCDAVSLPRLGNALTADQRHGRKRGVDALHNIDGDAAELALLLKRAKTGNVIGYADCEKKLAIMLRIGISEDDVQVDEGSMVEHEMDWVIEGIAYGDGKNVRESVLKDGVWHATGHLRGGLASYNKVTKASLCIHFDTIRDLALKTFELTPQTASVPKLCPVPGVDAKRFKTQKECDRIVTNNILRFCRQHPGVAVLVGGPGARENNLKLEGHFVMDKAIHTRAQDLDCVADSIAHAVKCMRGQKAFEMVVGKLETFCTHFLNFGQVSEVLEELTGKLNMKKTTK